MTSNKIKLSFGLDKNNKLVHVADVESGRSCDCICLSCKSPLIAAKGRIKHHHFKHATVKECQSGEESFIHLAAKWIISEQEIIIAGQLQHYSTLMPDGIRINYQLI